MKTIQKTSFKIGLILFTIFFLLFFFFQSFSQKITPKMIHIAELSMNKYIMHTTSDFKLFILEKNSSDTFLKITENEKKEIVGIDYDMKSIYELADKYTNALESNLDDSTLLGKYISHDETLKVDHGIVLSYPIGIVSDSIFLANLGPRIPISIRFMDSVFSSVKTKVRDYGINNVLLEVYLDITVSYEILTPVTMEEKSYHYELLLDSKVIQGVVPNIYGGLLESRSVFFDIPF